MSRQAKSRERRWVPWGLDGELRCWRAVSSRRWIPLALVGLLALTGCGPDDGRQLAEPSPDLTAVPVATTARAAIDDPEPELATNGPGGVELRGTDFGPGEPLPLESGCEGPISPGLTWTQPPRRTTELALVAQDVDGDGAVQFLVTGMSPDTLQIPRGGPLESGEVRQNSSGTSTWTSPCPQDGFSHRIVFSLYLLDGPLPEGPADTASVVDTIRAAAYGSATIVATAPIRQT
jgi:phosphatidylethanolamine-binding protein (PEBP) family uncharacterized protein